MAVGRFQVMALLQAARAHLLGLPLESAYSWGLNRAIFFAAAKRGFRGGGGTAAGHGGGQARSSMHGGTKEEDTYHLGDEMAYKAGGPGPLRFTIGGKAQTEEDFRRQVESRFQGGFKKAWDEAVDYVSRFDDKTLRSGSEFFSLVYRPKRDEFAAKWSETTEGEKVAPRATARAVRGSISSRKTPAARRRSS
jgi:hypothetical protein